MTIELEYLLRGRAWDIVSMAHGGRNDVADFVEALPLRNRRKVVRIFELIVDADAGPFVLRNQDRMKSLGDDLYELKSDQVRLLFFIDPPRRTVVTNGFLKRTRKTPARELASAVRARARYYEELR